MLSVRLAKYGIPIDSKTPVKRVFLQADALEKVLKGK